MWQAPSPARIKKRRAARPLQVDGLPHGHPLTFYQKRRTIPPRMSMQTGGNLPLIAAIASCAVLVLNAQPVFTAQQAEAGKTAYQSTCVKCHTDSLRGRKGAPGELPPLSSLPADMLKTVRMYNGKVPPLAGPVFVAKWGAKTTKDLSTRIDNAVGGFPPEGRNSTTYLEVTAYVLEVNGAQPGSQALTADTAAEVRSVTGHRVMPANEQNALVEKYCAVCHNEQFKNGGLSLTGFDAASVDPSLAAMLASKLPGAFGAAGIPLPDRKAQDELQSALSAESAGADQWTVRRDSKALTATIVQKVPSAAKANGGEPDVYRLIVTCDSTNRQIEAQLAWSPGVPPQGQMMSAAVDGDALVGYKIEGSEKMAIGGTSGPGAIAIALPSLPQQTLTIRNVFASETVAFPFGDLNPSARKDLSACFPGNGDAR